ncbi:MAG TPA: sodium-dependent bicarbonate transport family permease [Pseudoxanthomonas sp.]|nr:sodium-dependent bicarbonate transport family permease [Pseudoxanthomonas sp.]
MPSWDLLTANLLSPVVLAFSLGLIARLLRSDLEIPAAIQSYLSIFLLLAIGLKGGVALGQDGDGVRVLGLVAVTVLVGLASAGSAYLAARWWLRDDRVQAAALCAHFGSVSAVTFIAAQQYVERAGMPAEGLLVALVVAMEIPAILFGLMLGKGTSLHWSQLREVLTGKTAVLLLGGLAIGALAGKARIASVDAMYVQLFQGTLMLFMLDMGMVAANQLRGLRAEAARLVPYAIALPLLHGTLGALLGSAVGLGVGGATVFGTMAASASYIAAPASIRASLPEANVGRCLTAALGIAFPFNLAVGIPLYALVAQSAAR